MSIFEALSRQLCKMCLKPTDKKILEILILHFFSAKKKPSSYLLLISLSVLVFNVLNLQYPYKKILKIRFCCSFVQKRNHILLVTLIICLCFFFFFFFKYIKILLISLGI